MQGVRTAFPDRSQLYDYSQRHASHGVASADILLDLSAAVDVYSDWVDACDSVAKQSADVTGRNATNSYRDVDLASRGEATAARGDEYDDDDGFVENDEVDPEAEYA